MSTFRITILLFFCTILISQTSLQAQACDCNEYIYLNEPPSGSVHKYLINPDGSLTEVGSPWYGGSELPNPHGLTMDQNGNIYVGEHVISSDIRQLSCDGQMLPESEFVIPTGGQFNLGSLDNYIYYNDRSVDGIVEYDICTGETRIAEFCGNQTSSWNWGFFVDPVSRLMYATYDLTSTGTNLFWVFDQSDFDNDPATCIDPLTLDSQYPATNAEARGVTTDLNGNIYIVIQDDANQTPPGSYILKFDANGNHLATSPVDSADDGVGFNKLIGVVYSCTADLIYASTEASFDDCIVIFDTDLNLVGTGVPSPGGGLRGKGIAIIKECCPTMSTVVIDTIICATGGDRVSLQEIISCDGTICEGSWQELAGNTGVNYRSCDETVTFNTDDACGSFTYSSDGTGTNAQCGAFSITVNFCVECPPNACESPSCDPVPVETLCVDGSGESLTLACQDATLTNIVWYNSMGDVVGTDCNLPISTSMVGDGSVGQTMCFFYEAIGDDSCPAESCCPIIVEIVDCCPTDNCFNIGITRN